ncbi:hypothetical protein AAVH_24953 [Aphelenchoides avenae]|nr:hypothetical protein AAVH_24953 [Aphelenchus avenae]
MRVAFPHCLPSNNHLPFHPILNRFSKNSSNASVHRSSKTFVALPYNNRLPFLLLLSPSTNSNKSQLRLTRHSPVPVCKAGCSHSVHAHSQINNGSHRSHNRNRFYLKLSLTAFAHRCNKTLAVRRLRLNQFNNSNLNACVRQQQQPFPQQFPVQQPPLPPQQQQQRCVCIQIPFPQQQQQQDPCCPPPPPLPVQQQQPQCVCQPVQQNPCCPPPVASAPPTQQQNPCVCAPGRRFTSNSSRLACAFLYSSSRKRRIPVASQCSKLILAALHLPRSPSYHLLDHHPIRQVKDRRKVSKAVYLAKHKDCRTSSGQFQPGPGFQQDQQQTGSGGVQQLGPGQTIGQFPPGQGLGPQGQFRPSQVGGGPLYQATPYQPGQDQAPQQDQGGQGQQFPGGQGGQQFQPGQGQGGQPGFLPPAQGGQGGPGQGFQQGQDGQSQQQQFPPPPPPGQGQPGQGYQPGYQPGPPQFPANQGPVRGQFQPPPQPQPINPCVCVPQQQPRPCRCRQKS